MFTRCNSQNLYKSFLIVTFPCLYILFISKFKEFKLEKNMTLYKKMLCIYSKLNYEENYPKLRKIFTKGMTFPENFLPLYKKVLF